MNRDEQRGVRIARDLDALGERDEHVGPAGQHHLVAAPRVQFRGKRLGEIEDDILLDIAAGAGGAEIDAAMRLQNAAESSVKRPRSA